MIRYSCIAFIFIFFSSFAYSQFDKMWLNSAMEDTDSMVNELIIPSIQVAEYLDSLPRTETQAVVGGQVNSIYHEAIDSVNIVISIDGQVLGSEYCENGLFGFVPEKDGELIDLSFSHPDYHNFDTSFVFSESDIYNLRIKMNPKYKILLRGRVYAGNMPLEGVNVSIKHLDQNYRLLTRACFYDKEDYWNCLFDGMFKTELTTESPRDSIWISLTKEGMKPFTYGMTFQEYQGDIMQFKMRYQSNLPTVPTNNINLKLGFPFLSLNDDWFVSISYYRQVSKLKRLGYGLEANMYITNVSVPVSTFPGLDPTSADSSYITSLIGPSLLYYFISPEKRMFSSYVGCSFSMDLKDMELAPQLFLGTRIFLDLNKAISLELRYTEFDKDIMHYTFNPYGNAYSGTESETFSKLHATIGIQVVF